MASRKEGVDKPKIKSLDVQTGANDASATQRKFGAFPNRSSKKRAKYAQPRIYPYGPDFIGPLEEFGPERAQHARRWFYRILNNFRRAMPIADRPDALAFAASKRIDIIGAFWRRESRVDVIARLADEFRKPPAPPAAKKSAPEGAQIKNTKPPERTFVVEIKQAWRLPKNGRSL